MDMATNLARVFFLWKYSSKALLRRRTPLEEIRCIFFILLLFSLTKVAGVSDTKKAFLRMCTADLQISHAGRITLSTKNSSQTYLDQFSLLFVCELLQIIDLKKKNVFLLLYSSFFFY